MPSEPKQAIKIKGLDVQEFWQNNLSKAIRDIQNEYDTKLDLMRQDCETRFAAQMRQVQSGAVRDNMENKQAKEVSKKLQSQLQGSSSKVAEMEAKNGALQAEMSQLRNMIQGLETELESEKSEHMASKSRLQAELEACVEELRLIMDAKLSLELEISCYRKLLEGEENRFKNLVENAISVQNKGATNLSNIIMGGGSTSSSSSSPTVRTMGNTGGIKTTIKSSSTSIN
ncbi:hypothetical protein LOTGIDRAFT_230841 [Lottia gigantea]|uniref:IF rod domain-containing protein n=1 Tax=Lottia gigantea TaxID=225164 RepID=V4AZY6_LOTGI|nr:hypothetical protein LOTGIDRAFT_230841 [Lottia gigantea]ESP00731.1 hypothetical protein LOTGIDRAFT_230841 [Lottia gigantea]